MADPVGELLGKYTYTTNSLPADYYGMGYPGVGTAGQAPASTSSAPAGGTAGGAAGATGGGGGGSAQRPSPYSYKYPTDRLEKRRQMYKDLQERQAELAREAYEARQAASKTVNGVTYDTHFQAQRAREKLQRQRGRRRGGSAGRAPSPAPATGGTEGPTTETTSTRRQYVDVTTNEAFLNNFQNAFAAYVSQLQEAGELNPIEADWLMGNSNVVYGQFVAEQAKRAEAGEDIYEVLNQPDNISDVQLIGNRPGQVSVMGTETIPAGQEGGTTPVAGGAAGAAAGTQTNKFSETQELYKRPKVEVGYAYSPTEYLESDRPSSSLKLLYESRRRAGSSARGRTMGPVSTRRVY